MRRKGEIISMMPNRKDGKIDWLSTKDMDIEIPEKSKVIDFNHNVSKIFEHIYVIRVLLIQVI